MMPGPSKVSILFLRSSSASHSNSSSDRASLKVAPRHAPFGMAKAMLPQSMRMPLGPSAQQAMGMPNACSLSVTPPKAPAVPAVTLGEHMPSPRTMQARSSSESWARKSSMDTFPASTSDRRYPLSPVQANRSPPPAAETLSSVLPEASG